MSLHLFDDKDWEKLNVYPSAGIPWALDMISAAIAHQHGSGETFEARLALDILNLLTVRFIAIQIRFFSFCVSGVCDISCPYLQENSCKEAAEQVQSQPSTEFQLQHENTGIHELEKVQHREWHQYNQHS